MAAPDQLKLRVRGWFLSAGWTLEEATPPPSVAWVLHCRFGDPAISVNFEGSDQIIIRSKVRLTQAQQNLWASQGADARETFLWDLRFKLLAARAEFVVEGESEGEIRGILLMERIFEDGLTKDRFFQRVRTVRNAAILCTYLLAFGAGEPNPLLSKAVN